MYSIVINELATLILYVANNLDVQHCMLYLVISIVINYVGGK